MVSFGHFNPKLSDFIILSIALSSHYYSSDGGKTSILAVLFSSSKSFS